MLFFFELGLVLLIMLTVALGEFVGRGLALGLWLACTAGSLIGYAVVGRSLSGGEASSGLDAKWGRTLLYTWRRTNILLLIGALVVGAWYWLAVRQG